MTEPRVYLDWNATAPLRPEARAAMLAALEATGNPSSIHAEGRAARAIVEGARAEVAALVGAEPHNVIFTAGATEAANMALSRHWPGPMMGRLYVSALEHPCVLAGGGFAPVDVVQVAASRDGIIDISVLNQCIEDHDRALGPALAALMLANNETGILQPVADAAAVLHAAGGYLVCDAVQAAGRVPVNLKSLGADALCLSAHKLGGPKGVGALVLADEAVAPLPLIRGGGQERGHRAGTENVAAIAGFGAAAKETLTELTNMPRVEALRDRLETAAGQCAQHIFQSLEPSSRTFPLASDAHRNDFGRPLVGLQRLPNTALLSLPGATAETQVIQLDLAGIAVSAGSACSSGKVKRSHVLDAMGIDPAISGGTIRVSLGHTTTEADIERFLAAWSGIAARYNALRAA